MFRIWDSLVQSQKHFCPWVSQYFISPWIMAFGVSFFYLHCISGLWQEIHKKFVDNMCVVMDYEDTFKLSYHFVQRGSFISSPNLVIVRKKKKKKFLAFYLDVRCYCCFFFFLKNFLSIFSNYFLVTRQNSGSFLSSH